MHSTAAPASSAPDVPALLSDDRRAVSRRMRELLAVRGEGVYALLGYHLGWRDERGQACDAGHGKLLRPALLIATARGFGATHDALDAAVAIELLHAFSLVHDDIEDGDRERRHRPTLWALHGVPLALNAGDSLFALAHRTLIDAASSLAPERMTAALRLFTDACLRMIEGQHEDLAYEARADVLRADYLRMTSGKTGALIGASLALGALFGGATERDIERMNAAGVDMGIAFQAIDDGLGAWGDAARTGKAVGNDAARGKKSLPVIIAAELGCGVNEPRVRSEVQCVASEHAERALSAVRDTAISDDGARRLEAIATYILRREE